jgi:mono/diheme cytochrome c family protein
MMSRAFATLVVAFLAGPAARAGEPLVKFREQVAPILVDRCVSCHGPKNAFGGLRVDTYGRLMAGSETGRSVEPGKPDESLLLDLLVMSEPSLRMPKQKPKLPAAEIRILRTWVEQGAKGDGTAPDADITALVAGDRARAVAPRR